MDNNIKIIQKDLINRLSIYFGHSLEEISYLLGINSELNQGKLSTYTIANSMLKKHGIKSQLYEDQINLDTLVFKTVRLKKNHVPAENMSFENIDFQTVLGETWDSSFIRRKFSSMVICFIVFKEIQNKLIFIGLRVWKMPNEILETEVKNFWVKIRNILKEGVKIQPVKLGNKTIYKNNLPGSKDNKVMHVRPKAKDSNDKVALPNGEMITKQAYWLNASYIGSILTEIKDIVKNIEVKVKPRITINPTELKKILKSDLYSVEEVVTKLKLSYPDVSYLDITSNSLKGTTYKLQSPFIVKESIDDVDEYLDKLILSNLYLNIDQYDIFETPYIKRKINNYENAFKLIKVEPKMYITSTGLENAGVSKGDLQSYINEVEKFKKSDEYFTIKSIRKEGFYHPIDEFGFDIIFYEDLLKKPNNLQNIHIAKHAIFVKSKKKKTFNHLLKEIMNPEIILSLDDFQKYLTNSLLIHTDYQYAKQLLKESNYHYSEDLEKLFLTKDDYLNYLYKY